MQKTLRRHQALKVGGDCLRIPHLLPDHAGLPGGDHEDVAPPKDSSQYRLAALDRDNVLEGQSIAVLDQDSIGHSRVSGSDLKLLRFELKPPPGWKSHQGEKKDWSCDDGRQEDKIHQEEGEGKD